MRKRCKECIYYVPKDKYGFCQLKKDKFDNDVMAMRNAYVNACKKHKEKNMYES